MSILEVKCLSFIILVLHDSTVCGDGHIQFLHTGIKREFLRRHLGSLCVFYGNGNEDDSRRDAEEYVAVQSAIDEVKDAGVFVLATVNEIRKLPPSLKRSGRFDRKIVVLPPTSADAEAIIRHYLRDKKLSDPGRITEY